MSLRVQKILLSKYVHLIARLLLGGLFIYASLDKIVKPEEFSSVVQSYGILPAFGTKVVAYTLPWVELICGIFLILGLFVRESALILSTLLLVFMVIIGAKSLSGPIQDCGCFGKASFLSTDNPVALLLRDLVFLFFGLLILWEHRGENTAAES